jgi:hypothetical protein
VDDLESRVLGELPDETSVYPGHGDDTTIGAERPSLPKWKARAGELTACPTGSPTECRRPRGLSVGTAPRGLDRTLEVRPTAQSPTSADFPTRPADLPYQLSYPCLAERVLAHEAHLVDARHDLGDPLSADELAAHALAALACQHALAERILWSRWCNTRAALTFGATVDQTAAAIGLDVDR